MSRYNIMSTHTTCRCRILFALPSPHHTLDLDNTLQRQTRQLGCKARIAADDLDGCGGIAEDGKVEVGIGSSDLISLSSRPRRYAAHSPGFEENGRTWCRLTDTKLVCHLEPPLGLQAVQKGL